MASWVDKEKTAHTGAQSASGSDEYVIREGSTEYTAAEGLNSSTVTYQDASGAPVETASPLGYSVDVLVGFCLNINQMVGTGIFSTREWIISSIFPA
jgi:hypothetical protein